MATQQLASIDLNAVGVDEWRDSARQLLAEVNKQLADRFDAGAEAEELLLLRCRAVDQVVRTGWRIVAAEPFGLTLMATGGYGRRELYPQSDIDLLILGEPAHQDDAQQAIQEFLAGLWDAGLAPGHASRSIRQCIDVARDDLTVATSLIDARLLVGERRELESLKVALNASDFWPPKAFFDGKREELRQRHARYNDTAYNLEPNLKEGPGGLRDLHTLAWLSKRLCGVDRVCDLEGIGLLGSDEAETLSRELWSLARLRIGLHLVAGRREERLLFEHQTWPSACG